MTEAETIAELAVEREMLLDALRATVKAHETGRYEPAQAAYEMAKEAIAKADGLA